MAPSIKCLLSVAVILLLAAGCLWWILSGDRDDITVLYRGGGTATSGGNESEHDDEFSSVERELLDPRGQPPQVAPQGDDVSASAPDPTPGLTMSGRVVDDTTDAPVAGAKMVPFLIGSFSEQAGETGVEDRSDAEPARSGADGTFTVTGLEEGFHRIYARHSGFAESYADGLAGRDDVEIRLRRGYRFFGHVLDGNGVPAPGVDVSFLEHGVSEAQRASTGTDGGYTTLPLPAGSYTLSVTPTENNPKLDGRMLRETRRAELVDGDVEVNFGPRPNQIVWRGTLFDGGGGTFTGTQMILQLQSDSRFKIDGEKSKTFVFRTRTDSQGQFKIGPLKPGTYDISVEISDDHRNRRLLLLDTIVFEQSGLIVRDLHLPNTGLSGVVIEERTGAPLRDCCGFVMASAGWGKNFRSILNADGRFSFRWIPPGNYRLTAIDFQKGQGHLDGIKLNHDCVVENLRIVLPSKGTLILRMTGLEEIRSQSLSVMIENTPVENGCTFSDSISGCVVDPTGICELTTNWEPGSWKIVLEHEAIGYAEHSFEIRAGRKTKVELDRSAFSFR